MRPISPLTPAGDFRWLFLDLNSYFASVEQQLRPELRGKPVAVVPVETDATCAIAASYEAKAYGIKTGTMIYEAKAKCPGLICVLANHEAYVEYHHRIMAEIDKHLPVEIIASIDEAACRLTAHQCCEEEALRLAHAIKEGIAKNVGEYIKCSIGIAPNRHLAKIATDLQKPDGLVVLRAAELPGPLLRLELQDIPGIGRNMLVRLKRAGIFTMEHLWEADSKTLRRVWGGVMGERFWYGLHGYELPEQATTRRNVGHSHVLAPEWRPPERAAIVARRLLLKAGSRLRRMGYHAQMMQLSLRIENGPRLQAQQQFFHACDNHRLQAVLQALWAALATDLQGKRVKKVSVQLYGLVPEKAVQTDLFDSTDLPKPQQREALSRAMDALNARYGRDTVVMGFLPRLSHNFSGTKIAFTRIPDQEEFHE